MVYVLTILYMYFFFWFKASEEWKATIILGAAVKNKVSHSLCRVSYALR